MALVDKKVRTILKAINQGEIRAYFQPLHDTVTGRISGAEALARWTKSDGSVILPAEFVPDLEKSDAINELDWFMAESVLKVISGLGDQAIPISVNFSRWHVKEADFTERLSALIGKYNVDKRLFEIEITESALMTGGSDMIPFIKKVRETGIRIAVDDFGSGLSSLSFVKDAPVDILKIDKSLFSSNCQDEKERIVLESIFHFAGRLHLETVAEGVETTEQLGFLRSVNCDSIQGYLFEMPMPEDKFIGLCRLGKGAAMHETDILEQQTPASASQLLLSVMFRKYPLIIFANLSKNSYYMMAYENFTAKFCPATGNFDELIEHGSTTMQESDRESFKETFSRKNLIKQYNNGEKTVSLVVRQVGNDGIYRRVEVTDYFVKSPASDDILVISLNTNLE